MKTALPEFGGLLDQHRSGAFSILLPDLEERLVAELKASAEGRDSDPQSVERARKVAELAAQQEMDRAKEKAEL